MFQARDRTCDLPFPGADFLPTELSAPVKAVGLDIWNELQQHISQ